MKESFNVRQHRPWLAEGKSWIMSQTGEVPCRGMEQSGCLGDECQACGGTGMVAVLSRVPSPTPAKLTKLQWLEADQVAAREFLAHAPVCAALTNLSGFRLSDAWNKPILEYQTMTDQETMDSDGLPAPKFHLVGLPLPITHVDFTEIDLVGAAAGKLGVGVERTVLGINATEAAVSMDGVASSRPAVLRGLLNHPNRIVMKSKREAWGLEAVNRLKADRFHGPYLAAFRKHPNDDDRSGDAEDAKLVGRLLTLPGVVAAVPSRQMPEGQAAVVQVTPDSVRMVVGQEVAVVQWGEGFKVLCVLVPDVRTDFGGGVGVCHLVQLGEVT